MQTEVMGATLQVTPITQDVACSRKTRRLMAWNDVLYVGEYHGSFFRFIARFMSS
jgi:hypothetical protein